MEMLKDNDIRTILLQKLEEKHIEEKNSKIVNELGIIHGRSRVDVAVINGVIHGYEIKSESDTLNRLPRQIDYYNRVFDRMTIVVQRKYLQKVREVVPKWWGIILVTRKKDELKLKEVRKGQVNKGVEAFALSHLLWRDEALEILKNQGLQKGYLSKPREVLYEKICECMSLEEVKSVVNSTLKQRTGWKNHERLKLDDDLSPQ
ncbi:sce7726 family protein [Exiguobacterium sp. s127]|uniref:sce7726 family protein n=1 Tax=Exiguobacterium sp. s127 TaxID=2751210 RepID=UPI001BE5C634|nr:sce7726 family protein [Exiguobacterium sp. s127]